MNPTDPPSAALQVERQPGRRFLLIRDTDVSGVSGTGIVVEGIEFHDKQCVLSWFGQYHSMEVHTSIEQVMKLHGHGGATRIQWIDLS